MRKRLAVLASIASMALVALGASSSTALASSYCGDYYWQTVEVQGMSCGLGDAIANKTAQGGYSGSWTFGVDGQFVYCNTDWSGSYYYDLCEPHPNGGWVLFDNQ